MVISAAAAGAARTTAVEVVPVAETETVGAAVADVESEGDAVTWGDEDADRDASVDREADGQADVVPEPEALPLARDVVDKVVVTLGLPVRRIVREPVALVDGDRDIDWVSKDDSEPGADAAADGEVVPDGECDDAAEPVRPDDVIDAEDEPLADGERVDESDTYADTLRDGAADAVSNGDLECDAEPESKAERVADGESVSEREPEGVEEMHEVAAPLGVGVGEGEGDDGCVAENPVDGDALAVPHADAVCEGDGDIESVAVAHSLADSVADGVAESEDEAGADIVVDEDLVAERVVDTVDDAHNVGLLLALGLGDADADCDTD